MSEKMTSTEFREKREAAALQYEADLRDLKLKLWWELDIIEIAYCGMNWLETGKVGGWDRLPEEFDF